MTFNVPLLSRLHDVEKSQHRDIYVGKKLNKKGELSFDITVLIQNSLPLHNLFGHSRLCEAPAMYQPLGKRRTSEPSIVIIKIGHCI